jgi:hypothetical protein
MAFMNFSSEVRVVHADIVMTAGLSSREFKVTEVMVMAGDVKGI